MIVPICGEPMWTTSRGRHVYRIAFDCGHLGGIVDVHATMDEIEMGRGRCRACKGLRNIVRLINDPSYGAKPDRGEGGGE